MHDDEQQIRSLLSQYIEYWRRADIENWAGLFTDDSDFITWKGLWWQTREETIAGHRTVADFIRSQQVGYQLECCKIRMLAPSVALVHAVWRWPGFKELPEAEPENRRGILTMVLVRTQSGWRIRASHNTRMSIDIGESR
jgi:uncharacterized protein (TIGR02246 family)